MEVPLMAGMIQGDLRDVRKFADFAGNIITGGLTSKEIFKRVA